MLAYVHRASLRSTYKGGLFFSQTRGLHVTPERPLRYPRFVVHQLNSYAYSALRAKDYTTARSLLNKSLRICKMYTDPVLLYDYAEGEAPNATEFDWWGSNHISGSLAVLAEVATEQQNYAEAIEYLLQIHAMNLKLHTVKGELFPHHSIMDLLAKIGELHFCSQNYEAAKKVFDEIIELDQKYMGPISHEARASTGTAYRFKAKMAILDGNATEALRLMKLSLSIHKVVLGPSSHKTYYAMADLGRAHYAVGEYEQARITIEKVGSLLQRSQDHSAVAELETLHREIYKHLGRENPLARKADQKLNK